MCAPSVQNTENTLFWALSFWRSYTQRLKGKVYKESILQLSPLQTDVSEIRAEATRDLVPSCSATTKTDGKWVTPLLFVYSLEARRPNGNVQEWNLYQSLLTTTVSFNLKH
ncbi:unnamed protein product [Natator depressus]